MVYFMTHDYMRIQMKKKNMRKKNGCKKCHLGTGMIIRQF